MSPQRFTLALALAAGTALPTLAPAEPVFFKDRDDLHISDFSDPTYPVPRIGEREIRMRFTPESTWGSFDVYLQITSRSLDGVSAFVPGPGSRHRIDLTPNGDGSYEASFVIPWEKPDRTPGSHRTPAKGSDLMPDDTPGFYRWSIQADGGAFAGDIHAFTNPRRIVIAVLGDSFGSGEGAPSRVGSPWISEFDGELGHRSPVSGQELAARDYAAANPTLAYDYVNVSSSGAIAHDIHSSLSQSGRNAQSEEDPPQGVKFVQADKLEEWLARQDYRKIDALVLSCGGNDLGFSTILTNYLGLNFDKIGDAALDSLSEPLCIATGVVSGLLSFGNPLAAATAYASCVFTVAGQNIVHAIYDDYTFATPYDAKWITGGGDIGKARPWPFSRYANRLSGEYRRLEQRLVRNLSAGGASVEVRDIAATEYPNPLRGASRFEERLPAIAIAADRATIPIFDPPPPLDPVEIDLRAQLLRVVISRKETTEVNSKLAVQVNVPPPADGGLNHRIRGIVNSVGGSSSADWTFVETHPYMPSDGALPFANRHFNTLNDAVRKPGRWLKNNAIHPNNKGHENIYRPAVLSHLTHDALSAAARARAAEDDGLRTPAIPRADLAFDGGAPLGFDYQRDTFALGGDFTVVNNGDLTSPASTIEIRLFNADPTDGRAGVGTIVATIAVPPLAPNASFSANGFSAAIAPAALLAAPPYQCPGAPFAGFPQFADPDAALAYFFSGYLGFVQAALDPSGDIDETNERDNFLRDAIGHVRATQPSDLSGAISTLLAEAATVFGGAPEWITNDMLNNRDFLAAIGYYSPELDRAAANGHDASTAMAIAILGQMRSCASASIPGFSYTPPPPPEPRDGLRPICLFPPGEDCNQNAIITARVRGDLARFRSNLEFAANVPADARQIEASIVFENQFPGILGSPFDFLRGESITLEISREQAHGGLVTANETLPVEGGFITAQIDAGEAEDIELYEISAGLQPGSSELMTARLVSPEDRDELLIPAPQDGRRVYVQVRSLLRKRPGRAKSGWQAEVYGFDTVATNARLTSPTPLDAAGASDVEFAWQAPEGGAESFRLGVGSYPGGADVYPGPGDGKAAKDGEADSYQEFGGHEGNASVPELPRDGRTLYVTLGTQTGEGWSYESYTLAAPSEGSARLVAPGLAPGDTIGVRQRFQIQPSGKDDRGYILLLGKAPGDGSLFESGELSPLDAERLIDASFDPGSADEVYATLVVDGSEGERQEVYAFPAARHATLLTPYPGDVVARSEVRFEWGTATTPGAHSTRLSLGTSLLGSELGQEDDGPRGGSADFDTSRVSSSTDQIYATMETFDEEGRSLGREVYPLLLEPVLGYDYGSDSLNDFWQLANFGFANADAAPDEDPDGDGITNRDEELAGTDPNDAGDMFRPALQKLPSGRLRLTLPRTLAGNRYEIFSSLTLETWQRFSELNPTRSEDGFSIDIDATPGVAEEFYRVLISRPHAEGN